MSFVKMTKSELEFQLRVRGAELSAVLRQKRMLRRKLRNLTHTSTVCLCATSGNRAEAEAASTDENPHEPPSGQVKSLMEELKILDAEILKIRGSIVHMERAKLDHGNVSQFQPLNTTIVRLEHAVANLKQLQISLRSQSAINVPKEATQSLSLIHI